MADVEIKGRVTVDTSNTNKSINEMNANLADSKKALKDLVVGSAEYKKAQEDITRQTQELSNATTQSGGSFGKLKDTLNQTVPGFQGASQGASGFGKQLWALAANPIVLILTAIVAACALVYKAFASTNDGADKLDQVMSGVGATIEVLRDRILAVAKAITTFFSGDFKKGLEEGRQAVSGIGEEIAKEFAAAAKATKVLQDLEDSMRSISVGRAELNRDLAKAKEIMSNSDASFSERRKAINDVRAKEGEQNKKELEAAKSQYEAIKAQNALSAGVSDENLDKEASAKVAYINLQASSASQIRALNKLDKSLNKEAQAKEDEADKARSERAKNAKEKADKAFKKSIDALVEANKLAQLELQDIDRAGLVFLKEADAEKQRLYENEKTRGELQAATNKMNYEAGIALTLADRDAKMQAVEAVAGVLANASNLLGQTTAAGKAVAVASATISTYLSAQKAYESLIGTPFVGPVLAPIAAGVAVAGGLMNIKKILSVQVPGGGGGSMPSMPSMPSAPLAPQRSNTSLDSNSIQGIGNAAKGGVNRTFVLDSDITNNQERNARINRAARLG